LSDEQAHKKKQRDVLLLSIVMMLVFSFAMGFTSMLCRFTMLPLLFFGGFV
jgi:hypothetical protein